MLLPRSTIVITIAWKWTPTGPYGSLHARKRVFNLIYYLIVYIILGITDADSFTIAFFSTSFFLLLFIVFYLYREENILMVSWSLEKRRRLDRIIFCRVSICSALWTKTNTKKTNTNNKLYAYECMYKTSRLYCFHYI